MKQTENYIWNSFLNSGKRHLLLTGAHGAGKTTMFQTFCRYLKEQGEPLPGITTYVIPGNCVMLRENDSGEERKIGRFDAAREGRPMKPVSEGFAELGIPAMNRMVQAEGNWISIDELGFLESREELFQAAVTEAFEKKRVIAVLRKQEIPFLNGLKTRDDVFLADLDQLHCQIGCVIMASGMSRRFGENKLFAELEGKTFLQRILDVTEGLFAKRVVVTRNKEAEAYCRQRKTEVLLHTLPYRSDTVRLGTEYMEDMDGILFCPCDQPLLQRESLLKLRNAFSFQGSDLHRLAYGEQTGMPVVFGKAYYTELKGLPEGKGGSWLLKKYSDRVSTVQAAHPMELSDIDTKEELESLQKSVFL